MATTTRYLNCSCNGKHDDTQMFQIGVTMAKLLSYQNTTRLLIKRLRFIVLYTEQFGLQDCSEFLQIESQLIKSGQCSLLEMISDKESVLRIITKSTNNTELFQTLFKTTTTKNHKMLKDHLALDNNPLNPSQDFTASTS